MRIRIETHCHSAYSFDSKLTIQNIALQCVKHGINAVVICDHDICGITDQDVQTFEELGIRLFKAIEFTTVEGVHLIGVSDAIQEMERPPRFYGVAKLASALRETDAFVIIPHPFHETGLLGNDNVCCTDREQVLKLADSIEANNYGTPTTESITPILGENPHLISVVGSDAHASSTVGAFYNEIERGKGLNSGETLADLFYGNTVVHCCRRRISFVKKAIKRMQKTKLYGNMINLFPADFRRRVKNKLINH